MKKLFATAIGLITFININAQNVGIGTTSPVTTLDVHANGPFVSKFNGNGTTQMYLGLFENNAIKGYMGSYSGAADDVDFGTASGNLPGKLHFTIQSIPKMTIDKNGNVGIGNTSPHSSAALDISSGTRGLLLPRMAATQRKLISSPAKGLMVYDTTQNEFFYFDGGAWLPVNRKNYDSTGINYFNTPGTSVNLPTGNNNLQYQIISTVNSGYIYDNGGPAGNYTANNHTEAKILFDDSTLAVTVSIEQMQTEAGQDILYIISGASDTIATLSGTQSGTFTLYEECRLSFKTNGTNQYSGFAIKWGRLKVSDRIENPSPHFGWHFINNKMAARGGIEGFSGGWNADSAGKSSFAYGYSTKAKGDYSGAMGALVSATGMGSFAFGVGSKAAGQYSTANGNNCESSGDGSFTTGYINIAHGTNSFAGGNDNTVNGNNSFAFGFQNQGNGTNTACFGTFSYTNGWGSFATGNYNTATGDGSFVSGSNSGAGGENSAAIGSYALASGNKSIAMGSQVSTNSKTGSFFFGDSDPHFKGIRYVGINDQFVCRFNGGYYFITSNSGADIGVQVVPGGNAWSSVSNRNVKENFELTDGEAVLQKLRAIPFGSWNYIGQNPQTQRHYGIMAQDFYNAYGKDSYGTIGCDTLVNPIDMQGIAFSAIQALEKRTSLLQGNESERIKMLEKENEEMRNALVELRKQISELKKQ